MINSLSANCDQRLINKFKDLAGLENLSCSYPEQSLSDLPSLESVSDWLSLYENGLEQWCEILTLQSTSNSNHHESIDTEMLAEHQYTKTKQELPPQQVAERPRTCSISDIIDVLKNDSGWGSSTTGSQSGSENGDVSGSTVSSETNSPPTSPPLWNPGKMMNHTVKQSSLDITSRNLTKAITDDEDSVLSVASVLAESLPLAGIQHLRQPYQQTTNQLNQQPTEPISQQATNTETTSITKEEIRAEDTATGLNGSPADNKPITPIDSKLAQKVNEGDALIFIMNEGRLQMVSTPRKTLEPYLKNVLPSGSESPKNEKERKQQSLKKTVAQIQQPTVSPHSIVSLQQKKNGPISGGPIKIYNQRQSKPIFAQDSKNSKPNVLGSGAVTGLDSRKKQNTNTDMLGNHLVVIKEEEVNTSSTTSTSSDMDQIAPQQKPKSMRGRKRIHDADKCDDERGVKRRERNNVACRNYRRQKKSKINSVLEHESDLVQKNFSLKETIKSLSKNIEELKQKLGIVTDITIDTNVSDKKKQSTGNDGPCQIADAKVPTSPTTK